MRTSYHFAIGSAAHLITTFVILVDLDLTFSDLDFAISCIVLIAWPSACCYFASILSYLNLMSIDLHDLFFLA